MVSLKRGLLSLTTIASLTACSAERGPMQIEPGPEGTVMVVGAETTLSLEEKDFDFKVANSDTPGMSLGTAVSGARSSENNERRLFVPASITKVVTAALVLKHLGSRHRFKTEIVWDWSGAGNAHDLVVYADGDPRARFEEIVKGLKEKGVTRLTGEMHLVSHDDRRDQAAPPEGMDWEDYLNCYGARAQAFNLRRNCAVLNITGVNEAKWSDSGIMMPLTFDMSLGSSRSVSVLPRFDEWASLSGYHIRGTWTATSKTRSSAVPIANTKAWYGNVLLRELSKKGIDVTGVKPVLADEITSARLRGSKSSRQVSLKITSSAMSDILAQMNKPSDNFLADALFRAAAEKGRSSDLREAAAEIVQSGVQEWMNRSGHPEYASEIKLVDGAGLSRANRVSPRAFLALLKEFAKEPNFPALWNSLAIAGVDGTLRGRMKGTAAQGVVRGKTGTLRGAYQLVGYVPRKGSDGKITEYVPFVVLSSANQGNRFKVRDFQNRLVARLAEKINR